MTIRFSKIIVLSVLLGGYSIQTNAMLRGLMARASHYIGRSVARGRTFSSQSWKTTYPTRTMRFSPAIAAAGATFLYKNNAYAEEKNQLAQDQDIDKCNIKELLVEACEKGDVEAVRSLSCKAIQSKLLDRKDVFKIYIQTGYDVITARGYGETLLGTAVLNHDQEMVKLLVDAGSDVDEANEDGLTPLMHAVYSSPEMVQILIKAGADLDAVNKAGMTALDMAEYEIKSYFKVSTSMPTIDLSEIKQIRDLLKKQKLELANQSFNPAVNGLLDREWISYRSRKL